MSIKTHQRRVLLLSHLSIIRAGLKQVLGQAVVPFIIGETEGVKGAIKRTREENWDIVIVDFSKRLSENSYARRNATNLKDIASYEKRAMLRPLDDRLCNPKQSFQTASKDGGQKLDLIKHLGNINDGPLILITSPSVEDTYLKRGLQAGAAGYLQWEEIEPHLLRAIDRIMQGVF